MDLLNQLRQKPLPIFTNLTTKRKFFPDAEGDTNYYLAYRASKEELGNYRNIWIRQIDVDKKIVKKPKPNKTYPTQPVGDDIVYTIVKVDEDTALNLYRKIYNPVQIMIIKSYNTDTYTMKAMICSIDDSSYGVWWQEQMNYDDLVLIRTHLMKELNSMFLGEVNGHKFIDACLSFGADPKTIDYN